MSEAIKNILINPNLSIKRCWDMVNRVETVRQGAVAEAWLAANKVISTEEFNELMMALTWQIRDAFRRESGRA